MDKKRLTWENLADIYDKTHHNRPARTLPMSQVIAWAEQRKDLFTFDEEGYVYAKSKAISEKDTAVHRQS